MFKSFRSVQSPSFILPRVSPRLIRPLADAGEERGGGLTVLNHKGNRMLKSLALTACTLLAVTSAYAQAPFYQGKTVTLIIGLNPGGTGDLRIKAMTPYLTKYIPGNPNVVAQYVPGAGGRTAANQMYKSVKPDGLTIANLGASMVTNAVLGASGVEYDVDKFVYLGSPDSIVHWVFATRKEAGLNVIHKLRAASGLRIGAQSVGHTIYITGRLFAWVLGIREPKFVVGYSGPEIDIAMQSGEVDARSNLADTVLQRNADWLEKGLIDFHTILEVPKGNKHPRFGHLPELESFAKSDRERKVLAMQRGLRQTGSPYVLPPGTPKERVETFRTAMRKTFEDPGFHADFKKYAGEQAMPILAEEEEKVVRAIPRDSEIRELFKMISGEGPLPPR
jgi:tripartite-type tricarboxylate transporter receptor subunit TctC